MLKITAQVMILKRASLSSIFKEQCRIHWHENDKWMTRRSPIILVGIPHPDPGREKAEPLVKFDLSMEKSNRKTPFLIPLKVAVYLPFQLTSCSALAPFNPNNVVASL